VDSFARKGRQERFKRNGFQTNPNVEATVSPKQFVCAVSRLEQLKEYGNPKAGKVLSNFVGGGAETRERCP